MHMVIVSVSGVESSLNRDFTWELVAPLNRVGPLGQVALHVPDRETLGKGRCQQGYHDYVTRLPTTINVPH
jgi:hypothetical protein